MLKYIDDVGCEYDQQVSVLFNEPKLLKSTPRCSHSSTAHVSVLFNEPKLLKLNQSRAPRARSLLVSVLFNEPKLLKFPTCSVRVCGERRFSALQRAEIAEISVSHSAPVASTCFSALQRAEIAEIVNGQSLVYGDTRFSALQRAEIAEMYHALNDAAYRVEVSVLFNEPKLLKFSKAPNRVYGQYRFQCSSTSRNC